MAPKNKATSIPAHSTPPFSVPIGTIGELTDLGALEHQLAEAKRAVEEKMKLVEAARIAQEEHRKNVIASMPAMLGCSTIEELIMVLQNRNGKPKNQRTVMTPEKEAELVRLVKENKTGREIAETLKISLPTVAAYKDKHHLTRKRTTVVA